MATILVADDDLETAKAIEAILLEHGHRILSAAAGETALELACTRLPDVIVTDRDMPGMGGVALCKELNRYPATAQIPVIMISGRAWAGPPPAPWSMYLRKPVSGAILELAIETFAAQRCRRVSGLTIASDRAPTRWAPVSKKLFI